MVLNLSRKCTALPAMKKRRPLAVPHWAPAIGLVGLLLGGVPPARADIELGHEGNTGRHRLADMYDSPGAICDIVVPGRGSLGETWLRVNPPVMFARDRTPGLDEQVVGWRATISTVNEETGAWRVVRQSDTTRALANDDLASYFDGQSWLAAFPLSRATYGATIEMLWYDPADSDRIDGKATHAVEHYAIVLRHGGGVTHGRTSSLCRAPR